MKMNKVASCCLVGYCFHCGNFATWDEEKQRMVCFAYLDGIPDEVMRSIDEGKRCPKEEMPNWDEEEED